MTTNAANTANAGIPLTLVGPGRPVHVVHVEGGQCMQSRLASMGLLPGVLLEVLTRSFGGPMLIMVNQTRLMLGRGMAHRIRVRD